MDYDKNGFPVSPGFEDDRPPIRPQITRGRMGVLAMVLGLGLLLALVATLGSDAVERLRDFMPVGSRNAILNRVQVYLMRGDVERALKECDRLVELDPKEGHSFKAAILSEVQRYEEAADEYSKLIEIEPGNAVYYNNRAYHRALARTELDEAMVDVERALELTPDVPAYIDTRGFLHYLSGRFEAALEDFNTVLDDSKFVQQLEDRPQELGEIYFHRGLVYKQMRQLDKAEHDFQLAHRLGFRTDAEPEPVRPPAEKEEDPIPATPQQVNLKALALPSV